MATPIISLLSVSHLRLKMPFLALIFICKVPFMALVSFMALVPFLASLNDMT